MTSLPHPVLHRRRSVRIGIRLRHSAPRSLDAMNAGVLRRCRRGARWRRPTEAPLGRTRWRPCIGTMRARVELSIGWRSSAIAAALRVHTRQPAATWNECSLRRGSGTGGAARFGPIESAASPCFRHSSPTRLLWPPSCRRAGAVPGISRQRQGYETGTRAWRSRGSAATPPTPCGMVALAAIAWPPGPSVTLPSRPFGGLLSQ